MRRLLGGLSVLLLSVAGGITSAAENPTWCRDGFICVPREEIVKDIEYHLELREKIAALKGRSSRFGLTVGCGFGVGAVVDSEWKASASPAGFCGVVYGIRF